MPPKLNDEEARLLPFAIETVRRELRAVYERASVNGVVKLSFKVSHDDKSGIDRRELIVSLLKPELANQDTYPLSNIEMPFSSAFEIACDALKCDALEGLRKGLISHIAHTAVIETARDLELYGPGAE